MSATSPRRWPRPACAPSITGCRRATSEAELLTLIARLNADPEVNGILVQMPLPEADRRRRKSSRAIDPAKDVDGFHPLNAGRLASGLPALVPCTPMGCVLLAKTVHASLAGLEAVVIGRSNIVGKPVAQLLLARERDGDDRAFEDATICRPCAAAPICSFAAVGRPEMVRGDWIKPGATVIDVGINRVPGEGGQDADRRRCRLSPKRCRSPVRSRRFRAASGR